MEPRPPAFAPAPSRPRTVAAGARGRARERQSSKKLRHPRAPRKNVKTRPQGPIGAVSASRALRFVGFRGCRPAVFRRRRATTCPLPAPVWRFRSVKRAGRRAVFAKIREFLAPNKPISRWNQAVLSSIRAHGIVDPSHGIANPSHGSTEGGLSVAFPGLLAMINASRISLRAVGVRGAVGGGRGGPCGAFRAPHLLSLARRRHKKSPPAARGSRRACVAFAHGGGRVKPPWEQRQSASP